MGTVVVVLPKLEDSKKVQKILLNHGFSDVFACANGSAALQEINRHSHGMVISGCRLKDMHYSELLENLPEHFEMVVMGSANVVGEAAGSGLLALTTPLKSYDLVNTVEMVLGQMDRRYKKSRPKKRDEREENYIRNAKQLLMERNYLTEEEAHRYIQKCSMDNGTNMVETAQMILTLYFAE